MFPGNSYGRLHVSAQGTLHIQGVQREDSGYLVCSALSVAGSDTARAFLQVKDLRLSEKIKIVVFIILVNLQKFDLLWDI